MVGVPGFEPGDAGIKTLCLTAWRYPIKFVVQHDLFETNCVAINAAHYARHELVRQAFISCFRNYCHLLITSFTFALPFNNLILDGTSNDLKCVKRS